VKTYAITPYGSDARQLATSDDRAEMEAAAAAASLTETDFIGRPVKINLTDKRGVVLAVYAAGNLVWEA
jgi:hypothetical protein